MLGICGEGQLDATKFDGHGSASFRHPDRNPGQEAARTMVGWQGYLGVHALVHASSPARRQSNMLDAATKALFHAPQLHVWNMELDETFEG